ncbi:MAG: Hsp20/alpha crystallin family protein [Chloroflexi bacterium]|nr:Hsp20/alpha crystallin family protein [Chloroflexota bacterium]
MSTERGRFRRGSALWRAPRELEEMRRRFEEDVVRPVMRAVWERIPEEVKGWSPSIDIFEKGDSVIVKVELPGMKQEDIDAFISGDTLTLKGERKPESGIKEENYDRSEIAYGNFYREVELPSGVDTKNIEAVYEDGILRITLQKAAGAKPKKVTVQVKKGAA